MTDYLDDKGEKIQKGFYKHNEYGLLFYFTGDYDIEEFPIFEIESKSKQKYSLFIPLVQQLSKISEEEVEEIIKKSGEKANWLEKVLQG